MLSAIELILQFWIGIAAAVWVLLMWIKAPYGRHLRPGWGPQISAKSGWVIMETASLAALWLGVWWAYAEPYWLPIALWSAHYVYRSWVFPFRANRAAQRMPLLICTAGVVFNGVNGLFNGTYLAIPLTGELGSLQMAIGISLFGVGAIINVSSDNQLLRLRAGRDGYQIPQGGLFRYVSCPNYLGEMIEWAGFAILCWNLPALAFLLWTAANLVPRALAHHRWYQQTFTDYPPQRRAILPGLL